jgi:hypothetical protein
MFSRTDIISHKYIFLTLEDSLFYKLVFLPSHIHVHGYNTPICISATPLEKGKHILTSSRSEKKVAVTIDGDILTVLVKNEENGGLNFIVCEPNNNTVLGTLLSGGVTSLSYYGPDTYDEEKDKSTILELRFDLDDPLHRSVVLAWYPNPPTVEPLFS